MRHNIGTENQAYLNAFAIMYQHFSQHSYIAAEKEKYFFYLSKQVQKMKNSLADYSSSTSKIQFLTYFFWVLLFFVNGQESNGRFVFSYYRQFNQLIHLFIQLSCGQDLLVFLMSLQLTQYYQKQLNQGKGRLNKRFSIIVYVPSIVVLYSKLCPIQNLSSCSQPPSNCVSQKILVSFKTCINILCSAIIKQLLDQSLCGMERDKQSKAQKPEVDPNNIPSDDQYESSVEDQAQVPVQNALTSAIFDKYKMEQGRIASVIRQEDEDNQTENQTFRFRIKNLDTGQELEIENEEMEEFVDRKLSEGRHSLQNFTINWKDFWINVNKNNEKLRQYCQQGQYDEAKTLLLKGQASYPALVNHKALDDWSPIHFACYQGHDDIVELLCEHEADVNAVTKYNRSGLHIATLRGHIQVVKMLLNYKIDADACDNDGNTALHFAAENGYKDIIVFLLDSKCKIKKNMEGLTPIHDCCDETLKKIFYQYGFKEDGDYQEYSKGKSTTKHNIINRVQHATINSAGITTDDFVFHKMLGKGSFGQVFLCHKKGDPNKRLFAMKVLSKDKVMTKNLKRYALTERNVMSVINHPFMVKLNFAFQSTTKLFLVMDYYPGGDLGKLISKKRSISEQQARKYICQLILAFEALHKNMIVFRDLKPDNVVLDYEGHCRLTDFGLSKEGIYNNTTGSFCGSVAYLAPEILSKQGHSRTVDWYLVGLLLYELIVGLPPYYNSKKEVLFDNIKRGPLKIPRTMSPEAKDLIKRLLCRDPRKRLGAQRDSQQLKQHEFFRDVNWQDVFNRKQEMPPIQQPKWNLNESIKLSFENSEPGKKIEGWTFIAQ